MKAQINWIRLSIGAIRTTQGKTLAVMEVSGGSQYFNAVNQLRVRDQMLMVIDWGGMQPVDAAARHLDGSAALGQAPFSDTQLRGLRLR